MTGPTTYEIALRGKVGARALRPLADDFRVAESEPGVTRLVGVIRDSSQMHGLVVHLASAGVDIVSVVPTNPPNERGTAVTHAAAAPNSSDEQRPDDRRVEAARRYVEGLKAFLVHAAVFAAGMVIIVTVNLITNLSAGIAGEWSSWWSIWAFIGWGSGIAVHGFVVWLNRPSGSSPTWEERQIDKVLSR